MEKGVLRHPHLAYSHSKMNPPWVETGNHLRLAIVLRLGGGDWLDDGIGLIKRAGRTTLAARGASS